MLTICILVLSLCALIYGMEEYFESYGHYISSFFIVFFIYIIVSGNYQNADSFTYENSYNINEPRESFGLFAHWGYRSLINICNYLHFSFIQYRFIVYGIGFAILLIAVRRVGVLYYPFFFLYFAFPMIIDSTQMKFFVAMCFITLAISFLPKGRKKDKVLFVVFLIVGSSFHITSLVFLPLVLLCDNNYGKKIKVLSVLPLVLFAALFSNRSMSRILSLYLQDIFFDSSYNRANLYLMSHTNYGFFIYFLATFVFIIIIIKMRKIILNSGYSTEREKKYSNIVFYCSIFSLAFLPLYFIKLDFARLLRALIPTYHMLFIMTIGVINRQYKIAQSNFVICVDTKKIMIMVMYFLMMIYMFYWEIFCFKDIVMFPFFDYNIIIE